MKIVFTGPDDVSDVEGKLQFGANPLENFGEPVGLPDVRLACPIEQTDGSWLVYGMECPHEKGDATWRIMRLRTYDGIHYDEREVLFESEPGPWLGNSSIAHNSHDGSFLCVKWRSDDGKMGMYAFGSQDGSEWSMLSDKPVYSDHDAGKIMFDPRTGEYVVYQATYQQHEKPYPDNCPENVRRVLHIRTSRDGIHWEPSEDAASRGPYISERLITPDDDDPPELEFYDFAAFPYQDFYVGMMQNYAGSPQFAYPWGPHGPHLSGEWWLSKDGRSWQRPFRDVFAPGPASWVCTHAPITAKGRHVWIIQSGAYGLPEDRMFFAGSLSNAAFTTSPLVITNPELPLLLNASLCFHGPDSDRGFRLQSYITAELLDERGEVIPGYETHFCSIRDISERETRLWWHTSSRMKRLGQKVRIRFYLRDARIYSLIAPEGSGD